MGNSQWVKYMEGPSHLHSVSLSATGPNPKDPEARDDLWGRGFNQSDTSSSLTSAEACIFTWQLYELHAFSHPSILRRNSATFMS